MKVPIYNEKGEETGKTDLPKEIFEVKVNPELVYQVAVSQSSNRRQPIAHTKDRGEVRGGGKKPWRQKGTGRARHGSTRSPIWRHGGVTFGPRKERNYSKSINQKMKRKALFMVLSSKAASNMLFVLDDMALETPKTKLMASTIKELRKNIEGFKGGKVLVALPGHDKNLFLATRNIENVNILEAQKLNAYDLLNSKYLLLFKGAVKSIVDTFSAKEEKSLDEK